MNRTSPPFRAEHIGSLVRPAELLRARAEHAAGRIDRRCSLTAIENEAIRGVVRLQEDVGLQVVTDGEFRRGTYSDAFTTSGISGVAVRLTEDAGWSHFADPRPPHGAPHSGGGRAASPGTGRRTPTISAFSNRSPTRTPKITLPGPCYIHYRAGRANISRDAYPDLDAFWSDLVRGLSRRRCASLAEAGCTYLQIDETSLVKLGDPRARAIARRARRRLARSAAAPISRSSTRWSPARPPGMTRRHPHLPQPGPELAGRCRLRSDRRADLQRACRSKFYFLEYDNARAGTLRAAALRARKDKMRGAWPRRLQGQPELEIRRLPQAAHRGSQPVRATSTQLALSPQCGFSTSATEHVAVTEEMEQAKLARIVEVAREVWGDKTTRSE